MRLETHRSHPRDSWGWIWPDVLIRVIPFWIVPVGSALLWLDGPRAVGLVAPPQGWGLAILQGLIFGMPMVGLAASWRLVIAPRYRLPTAGDQALQTVYYLVINAPAEEVFWRGLLQTQLIRGLTALGAGHTASTILGIAVMAALFGAYHRLGNYPWSFNCAAMLAGALFGVLYAVLPGPSIIVPTIVHGLTTAGYLSWGDVALHGVRWQRARRAMSAGVPAQAPTTPAE